MPVHFRDRLEGGKESPGVFIVSQFEPIGPVVEVLMMVWAASNSDEWHNQVRHLPFAVSTLARSLNQPGSA